MKGVKGFIKGHKHSEETKIKIGLANSRHIIFNCEECGKQSSDKPSHYNRKKHHFCSMNCCSNYKKKIPFNEQPAYKGIRKLGESKQIYHQRNVKNNPETIRHLKARRYARERGAEGNHTLQEWNDLKITYGNKCVGCGQEKKLTKDHIIPLSKGGSDYIKNIQPMCRNCNSKKWNHIYSNPELLK